MVAILVLIAVAQCCLLYSDWQRHKYEDERWDDLHSRLRTIHNNTSYTKEHLPKSVQPVPAVKPDEAAKLPRPARMVNLRASLATERTPEQAKDERVAEFNG